jgi:hypothetical protein
MKEWRDTIVDFYDNCGVHRPNVDENDKADP